MANRRNAQSNQIISGEFRQYFGVDIVREERSRILFESAGPRSQWVISIDIAKLANYRSSSRRPWRFCMPAVNTKALSMVGA